MKKWPTPRAGNPGSRKPGTGGAVLGEEVKKVDSESCPCSQVQEEDSSVLSFWDGEPSPLLSVTPTASSSSASGAAMWPTPQASVDAKTNPHLRKKKDRQTRNETMGSYRGDLADWVSAPPDFPFTRTSAPSTPSPDRATSSPAASPASRSARRGSDSVPKTTATYGLKPCESFWSLALLCSSERTCRDFSASSIRDAYAAGLIDGEGCVTLTGNAKRNSGYYYASVTVGMSAKGLPAMRWLEENYGGRVRSRRAKTDRWEESWDWRIDGEPAASFLLRVAPFLILKQEQARLCIALQNMVKSAPRQPNGNAQWTESMRAAGKLLKERMLMLNSKGPSPEPPKADGWFARYVDGHWETPVLRLDGTSEPFSETWPRRGSMRNGACWEQTTSVPRIDGSGSGFWPSATATTRECTPEQWQERREQQGGTLRSTYLQDAVKYQVEERSWPTPRVSCSNGPSEAEIAAGDPKHRLETAVVARGGATRQTWGTPTTRDHKDCGSMENVPENCLLGRMVQPSTTTGSLNPTWVGPLMGWPKNWEDSETPHVREFLRWLVSFRLSHMLYFTHGTTNHRTAEEVRAMRSRDDTSPDAERASGGHGDVPQEEVLLSLLCELKTALDEEADLSLACEEVDRHGVCGVWSEDQPSGAPRRWGPVPQPAGEHPDLVHHLSPLSPRYGVEAWLDGSWEAGIPRVATGVAHRVDRLRALGNGQVPQSMAAAFITLARQAGL